MLGLLVSVFCNSLTAQEFQTATSGFVSFNLGTSPVQPAQTQELSLFGCNTQISTRGLQNSDGSPMLTWNKDHQVMKIPYGKASQNSKPYFVSKYYMASPPVMEILKNPTDTIANIGLVIPDRFTFFGEVPVQKVYLDYEILNKVYLNFIDLSYDIPNDSGKTCRSLGVDLIPLNIQCMDFPWDTVHSIFGGKGASGIGRLRIDSSQKVFLLSKAKDKDFLNCSITILDDILLNHEVFIKHSDGTESKSLNLTEFYTESDKKGVIPLVCYSRTELPEGCKEPKP